MASTSSATTQTFEQVYAAIRALPEGQTGMILEPGELTVMSRPHPRHQFAMHGIRFALSGLDRMTGGQGWWFLSEVEVRFGERLVVPDILGVRVERMPEVPDDNPLCLVPDWTCEVLSPSTARIDRLKKLRIYAAQGVAWTWLVDPENKTIECFETHDRLPRQAIVAELADTVALPPFGIPIDVKAIWGPNS